MSPLVPIWGSPMPTLRVEREIGASSCLLNDVVRKRVAIRPEAIVFGKACRLMIECSIQPVLKLAALHSGGRCEGEFC